MWKNLLIGMGEDEHSSMYQVTIKVIEITSSHKWSDDMLRYFTRFRILPVFKAEYVFCISGQGTDGSRTYNSSLRVHLASGAKARVWHKAPQSWTPSEFELLPLPRVPYTLLCLQAASWKPSPAPATSGAVGAEAKLVPVLGDPWAFCCRSY